MDTPVSVIVAVGRDDISRCLNSLLAQTFPESEYEILLVSDRPLDVETSDHLRVIIVPTSNPSCKRNAGVCEARGGILAFIDDDAWADPHWVQNGVDFLKHYPGAAGVGGPRLLPEGATFREKATDIIANSKFFGNGHGNWREMRVSNRVPHGMINSCNYFVRRQVFMDLGGYNESIGYGGTVVR